MEPMFRLGRGRGTYIEGATLCYKYWHDDGIASTNIDSRKLLAISPITISLL